MGRYIKKFRTTSALGPTEERGVPMWAGYELAEACDDPAAYGLVNVDGWSGEELRERGVVSFRRVTLAELGSRIGPKRSER